MRLVPQDPVPALPPHSTATPTRPAGSHAVPLRLQEWPAVAQGRGQVQAEQDRLEASPPGQATR